MADILFRNLVLLDPLAGAPKSGHQVRVRDNQIVAVEPGAIDDRGAEVLDLGGRTLMPGLIDCHVHLHPTVLPPVPTMLPSLVTAHAARNARDMLMRGFTTVRDAGGADLGHKQAIERGLIEGPRLFVSGRAISQTGGHGDGRSPADLADPCPCPHLIEGIARVADGVAAVRRAVRDEIRLGADQIKVMAGGGVRSLTDPIDQLQYSMDELSAIVDEATRSHTYAMAHVYTAEGARRCVEAGVRTIEHGNFLDEPTAARMAQRGAYLVPTLVTNRVLAKLGRERGRSETSLAKNAYVLTAGPRALAIARAAGVKMAYGSDVSVALEYQSDEFVIRAEVLSPAEIIRSATLVGAEVVRMEGRLGVIAPGALADLVVVDGNPLENLRLLTGQGENLSLIMKDGRIFKDRVRGGAAGADCPSAWVVREEFRRTDFSG